MTKHDALRMADAGILNSLIMIVDALVAKGIYGGAAV